MRTTTRLCLVLAVVATAGLVAIPAAGAKGRSSGSDQATTKKQERSQNRSIRRITTRLTNVGENVNKRVDDLKSFAFEIVAKNTAQDGATQSNAARIKATEDTIAAIIPVVTDALTQLKNGLTTAGAGLTTLAAAYQSIEYGVAKVFATNGQVAAGSSVTSADIPDDGNTADVNGTALVVATNTPMTINLRADVRSNEDDNDAGDTVGQAGGFVYVKNTSQSFTDNDADVDPGGGVVAANRDATETVNQKVACTGSTPPVGIFGTLPGASIVTPSGTVTNLSLVNLPGGLERTDTTHPDAGSTSLLPAGCSFTATPGAVYEVYYAVSFVDIPTTTTPGATE